MKGGAGDANAPSVVTVPASESLNVSIPLMYSDLRNCNQACVSNVIRHSLEVHLLHVHYFMDILFGFSLQYTNYKDLS